MNNGLPVAGGVGTLDLYLMNMQNDTETEAIIGAAIEVHSILGGGFLEGVYHEALAEEFIIRGIPFVRETRIPIQYKGKELICIYRADLICFNSIIVELKAIKALSNIEEAQLINYLNATGLQRGLLLNFGSRRLDFRRKVSGYLH